MPRKSTSSRKPKPKNKHLSSSIGKKFKERQSIHKSKSCNYKKCKIYRKSHIRQFNEKLVKIDYQEYWEHDVGIRESSYWHWFGKPRYYSVDYKYQSFIHEKVFQRSCFSCSCLQNYSFYDVYCNCNMYHRDKYFIDSCHCDECLDLRNDSTVECETTLLIETEKSDTVNQSNVRDCNDLPVTKYETLKNIEIKMSNKNNNDHNNNNSINKNKTDETILDVLSFDYYKYIQSRYSKIAIMPISLAFEQMVIGYMNDFGQSFYWCYNLRRDPKINPIVNKCIMYDYFNDGYSYGYDDICDQLSIILTKNQNEMTKKRNNENNQRYNFDNSIINIIMKYLHFDKNTVYIKLVGCTIMANCLWQDLLSEKNISFEQDKILASQAHNVNFPNYNGACYYASPPYRLRNARWNYIEQQEFASMQNLYCTSNKFYLKSSSSNNFEFIDIKNDYGIKSRFDYYDYDYGY